MHLAGRKESRTSTHSLRLKATDVERQLEVGGYSCSCRCLLLCWMAAHPVVRGSSIPWLEASLGQMPALMICHQHALILESSGRAKHDCATHGLA